MRFQKLLCGLLTAMTATNASAAWAAEVNQSAVVQKVQVSAHEDLSAPGTGGGTMAQTIQLADPAAPLVENYLLEGKLTEGRLALLNQLKKHPTDDQSRFGLGMLQFLQALQGLKQSLYHYGLRNFDERATGLPFARLQVAVNPRPSLLNYKALRQMIETFRSNLMEADQTLSLITDKTVRLPLHFGMIKLNFHDEVGRAGGESLWNVYARMTNNTDISAEQAREFFVKFDRGDVHWLRGYCNLLSAVCEVFLAYDSCELFERTGHIFFLSVDAPYKFLTRGKHIHTIGSGGFDVTDLVAFIHLINCKIVEPERMKKALHHLEAVVAQSRISWTFIMAETDDDHEWLPNPRQKGVIPNMQVTDEMVRAWAEIMDQTELLLKGETLIPFWRGDSGEGVNVRQVFLQPRPI